MQLYTSSMRGLGIESIVLLRDMMNEIKRDTELDSLALYSQSDQSNYMRAPSEQSEVAEANVMTLTPLTNQKIRFGTDSRYPSTHVPVIERPSTTYLRHFKDTSIIMSWRNPIAEAVWEIASLRKSEICRWESRLSIREVHQNSNCLAIDPSSSDSILHRSTRWAGAYLNHI